MSSYAGRSSAPGPAISSKINPSFAIGEIQPIFLPGSCQLRSSRKSSFSLYHATAVSRSGTRMAACSTFQETNGLEELEAREAPDICHFPFRRSVDSVHKLCKMQAAPHLRHQSAPVHESAAYSLFALSHDRMAWTLSALRSRGNQWPDGRLVTERSWQVLRIGSPIRLRFISQIPSNSPLM